MIGAPPCNTLPGWSRAWPRLRRIGTPVGALEERTGSAATSHALPLAARSAAFAASRSPPAACTAALHSLNPTGCPLGSSARSFLTIATISEGVSASSTSASDPAAAEATSTLATTPTSTSDPAAASASPSRQLPGSSASISVPPPSYSLRLLSAMLTVQSVPSRCMPSSTWPAAASYLTRRAPTTRSEEPSPAASSLSLPSSQVQELVEGCAEGCAGEKTPG